MGTRTAVFRQVVRDHMRTDLVTVPVSASCGEAVARLREGAARASSVVAIADDGRPQGILTERDITRRVAFALDPETPVEAVMSQPLLTIRDDEPLFHAIGFMRRHDLRHMPVVDASGCVAGMLDLDVALSVASTQMVEQIDVLTHEETLEGMQAVKAAQVEVADELFKDAVPAPEIQALLSHINLDLYARVTRYCLRQMNEAGLGAPPLAFSVIVMGSGGRGESYVYPDQDFGMLLGDYPDDAHARIDPWFIDLGVRMADALDAIGIPYCRGGVMASNPLWRKSITQWRDQIDLWVRKRHANFIRLADIFFDFVPAYGDDALAQALRAHVTRRTKRNHLFLQSMYGVEGERKVALGLFNRFITERKDAGHKGEINLKFTGTLPLVEAIRILALREGIAETSSLRRMAALHAAGVLADDEHDYLAGAFGHVTRLLLRQQIADFLAGRKVSNYVAPESLSERERDILIDSFKAIEGLLARLRNDFSGALF